jgi:16S rRNA (cytosine1402-N4)-methyltransferase
MLSHTPVLLDEVMQFLDPKPGGRFIDATLGGGGHARAIVERILPDGRLLAIDQDEHAIARARQALAGFEAGVEIVKGNFREVFNIAVAHGFSQADGVLGDVGVSSMMLDDAARGFSFMREGKLDMRMDQDQEMTAADVVNELREKEIADILFTLGEERRSRAIASSIVRSRPLTMTSDLVRAVQRVLGGPRYGHIHPATRTFQALRVYVNDELGSLEAMLDGAMHVVRPGGRLVVLTFHSLEDRIVKNRFRASAVPGRALTKKVVVPSDEERRRNPRARSAKLRAWERSDAD